MRTPKDKPIGFLLTPDMTENGDEIRIRIPTPDRDRLILEVGMGRAEFELPEGGEIPVTVTRLNGEIFVGFDPPTRSRLVWARPVKSRP